MEVIETLIALFLHLDLYLADLVKAYGGWTYAILFLVIFCETGLVVTPFLPGDSLLFAAGALAAGGVMTVHGLVAVLFVAAVAGDMVNYRVGRWLGARVFHIHSRFLNQSHLERTALFYQKHGGKTIILARFIPILRTYAPCIAGIGKMDFEQFFVYNVAGGFLWVVLFVYGGFFFGTLPLVKQHFSLVVLGIIFVSVLPLLLRGSVRLFHTVRASSRARGGSPP